MKPKIDDATYDRISEALSTWKENQLTAATTWLFDYLGKDALTFDKLFNMNADDYIENKFQDIVDELDTEVAKCVTKEPQTYPKDQNVKEWVELANKIWGTEKLIKALKDLKL